MFGSSPAIAISSPSEENAECRMAALIVSLRVRHLYRVHLRAHVECTLTDPILGIKKAQQSILTSNGHVSARSAIIMSVALDTHFPLGSKLKLSKDAEWQMVCRKHLSGATFV